MPKFTLEEIISKIESAKKLDTQLMLEEEKRIKELREKQRQRYLSDCKKLYESYSTSVSSSAAGAGGSRRNVESIPKQITITFIPGGLQQFQDAYGSANDVATWNTIFDLPANGTPFQLVETSGETVTLSGGENITLPDNFLINYGIEILILEFHDTGCVLEVGDYAFSGTFGYSTLVSASFLSATIFGEASFNTCVDLVSVVAPNLTSIGLGAFQGSPLLSTFDFPLLESIGGIAFLGSQIVNANFPLVNSIGDGAFTQCTQLVSYNMPLLTNLPNELFNGCSSLASADLSNITTAGSSVFGSCTSLTTISAPLLTTLEGNFLSFCSSLISADFPLVTNIPTNSAFAECTSLTTVNLPNATFIGLQTFYGCSSLVEIYLPSAVTIDSGCFINCTSLSVINLPSCTNLGGTVGDDLVFDGITGNTISLTVPASLFTCDSGNPDGDIVILQSNNTVNPI